MSAAMPLYPFPALRQAIYCEFFGETVSSETTVCTILRPFDDQIGTLILTVDAIVS